MLNSRISETNHVVDILLKLRQNGQKQSIL